MSSQLTYEAFADFFIKADTDMSMELSIDELIESLSKHGYVGKEQQIRRAFKDADTDGDGQISFEEYMTAMGFTLIKKHKGTAIWRSFQEFDKSNSGFVVYTQVEIILQRVRKHFIFSEYRKLTDLAAKMKDSNGKLNYMDYVHELVRMGLIEIEGITELKEAKQKIAEKEVKEEVTAKQTQQVTMTAKPGETVAAASPLEEAPGFPRLALNKPAEASTQNVAGLKMPPKTQPKPGQAPPPGQKVTSPTSPGPKSPPPVPPKPQRQDSAGNTNLSVTTNVTFNLADVQPAVEPNQMQVQVVQLTPAKTPPATPPGKAETPKAAEPPLPKQEPPKPEAPKPEPPKQEQPKPEPTKPAAEPKAEAASVSVQLEQPKPVEPEPPKPAEPEPPKKEEPEPPKAAEPEVSKAAEPEQPKPVEPEEPAPVQEVVFVQLEPENKAENEAEQAKPEEPMTPVGVQVAEVKEAADTQPANGSTDGALKSTAVIVDHENPPYIQNAAPGYLSTQKALDAKEMIQVEESVLQLENEKSTPVIDPEQPCTIDLEKTTSSEGKQLQPTDLEQPDSSTSTILKEPVEMQPPATDPISVKLAEQEPTKSTKPPKPQEHIEEAEALHTGVTESSDLEPTSTKADETPSACKPPESPETIPAKHPTGEMPISFTNPASPQPPGPDPSASELILLSAYDYVGESQISSSSETNSQRLEGDGLPVSVPGNVTEEEKTRCSLSADVPTKDGVVNNTVQENGEAPSADAKKVVSTSIGLKEVQREATELGSNTEPEVKASKFAEAQFQNELSPEIAVCPGAGVPWSISTHYLTRNANEAMGILGDIPELGSWQPSQTVLATENPAGSGNWTCFLSLPPNTSFEWKWVVVPMSRGWVSRWELDPNPPRGNRKSNSGPGPKTVHYAWID